MAVVNGLFLWKFSSPYFSNSIAMFAFGACNFFFCTIHMTTSRSMSGAVADTWNAHERRNTRRESEHSGFCCSNWSFFNLLARRNGMELCVWLEVASCDFGLLLSQTVNLFFFLWFMIYFENFSRMEILLSIFHGSVVRKRVVIRTSYNVILRLIFSGGWTKIQ